MKQTLLRIQVPAGSILYGSRFRELMAKMPNVPSRLFHRASDQKTLPGAPPIRFVSGRQWVGILANPGYEQLVYDVMGMAVQAVTFEVGKSVPISIEAREVGIEATHYPVRYWIREMAVKRRSEWRKNSPIETVVEDILLRHLEKQAELFGLDLPQRDQLDLSLEVTRALGLRLQTTTGLTNEYVTLVNASFDINANIRGVWFAGNLTSRGYGRIGRDLQQLAFNLAREERQPRRFVQ